MKGQMINSPKIKHIGESIEWRESQEEARYIKVKLQFQPITVLKLINLFLFIVDKIQFYRGQFFLPTDNNFTEPANFVFINNNNDDNKNDNDIIINDNNRAKREHRKMNRPL